MRQLLTAGAALALLITLSPSAQAGDAPPGVIGAASTSIPFTYVDNRMMVRCTVDGQGPFTFMIDTGASDAVITPQLVRMLHLRDTPAGKTGGVGNGVVDTGSVALESIALGDLRFTHLPALVLDFSAIDRNIGFTHFDGILGYSLLKTLNLAVDVDHHMLTFSRATIPPPRSAHVVPFTVKDGLLHVDARIDGIAGSTIIDTGDRSSVTIFNRFAAAHGFATRYRALRNAVTGIGIGGPVYADVFRLPHLRLFDWQLDDLVARASRQHAGAFATQTEAASIGGGVLKRFNMIYDYPHGRLASWPSTLYGTRDAYDTTGMWLSQSARGPVVAAVMADAPAQRAGLRTGDVLLTVNGRRAGGWTIPGLRAYLGALAPGTRVTLTVLSHGATTTRRLTLRELV